MGGIGVITNPRSRQNRRNPELAERLAYVLGEKGTLAAPTDLDALDTVAAHFRDHGIEIVAINGGDGTNHLVLTALLRAYGEAPLPRIAMLRGGTMNTVASGLGIRGTPQELLGRLTSRYHREQPFRVVSRNLLLVNEYAGFLFGNGLISNWLEIYYEGAEPTPSKAAWLLARCVGSALIQGPLVRRISEPVRARVRVDGKDWRELPYLTIAAATVDDIGLGFRPFYMAPDHPGTLHAVGIGCTALQLAGQLWNMYRARPLTHPNIESQLGRRLEIEAEEPLGFMVDGDFHAGAQRIDVRVGPPVELIRL